ncbi:MAG: protein kinase [Acidobacteriota bacterium]|nr:protein kinase [Acidobacteriota bacterium]
MSTLQREAEIHRIYTSALALEGEARVAYLAEACGSDAELLQRVDHCLQAAEAGSALDTRFMNRIATGVRRLNRNAVEDMTGCSLGRYKLLDKAGEGGMGVVYKALDTSLDRIVALKVLRPGTELNAETHLRFEREGKVIAALDHPNIVTLYSREVVDGLVFLTMEWVPGHTLDQVIPPTGFAQQPFFHLALPLLEAMSAAHRAGIAHRDLKPANIMVVDGGVKILDFGLARREHRAGGGEDDPTFTTTSHKVMGTYPYMSPEQIMGRPSGCRSDVFSLGIILTEMLIGKRPFSGGSPAESMSAILRDDPAPLTGWSATSPPLTAMVSRCLAKDPQDRYSSAAPMAAELKTEETLRRNRKAHFSDALPAARGKLAGGLAAVRRVLQKNRALLAPVTALLVVAAVLFYLDRTTAARERVLDAARRQADYELACMFEERAADALVRNLSQEGWLYTLAALKQEIPADKKLVRAGGFLHDPHLHAAGRLLWTSPVAPRSGLTAFGPNGDLLVFAARDHKIRVIDIESGKGKTVFAGHTADITALVISLDGKTLATASEDNTIRLWSLPDTPAGALSVNIEGPLRTLISPATPLAALALAPTGGRLAASGPANAVYLWDEKGERLPDIQLAEGQTAGRLAFHPGGHRLFVALGDGRILSWDPRNQHRAAMLEGHSAPVLDFAFTDPDQSLVSASMDGTLRLWRKNGSVASPGRKDPVIAVTVSRGNLVSVSAKGVVKRWKVEPDEIRILASWELGQRNPVTQLTLAPARNLIAYSVPAGVNLLIRDLDTGEPQGLSRGHSGKIRHVAFSPNGDQVASTAADDNFKIWDIRSGHAVGIVFGSDPTAFAFSTDGREFAFSRGGENRIDLVEGSRLKLIFRGHEDVVEDVIFLNDGRLISASHDHTLRLWNRARPNEPWILRGHTDAVLGLDVSPDNRLLASASRDHTVRLWSIATNGLLRVLRGHHGAVVDVAFSPDGSRLASASTDKTIRLWSVVTGEPDTVFTGHDGPLTALAYSPEGRRLASSSHDQTIRLWDVASGRVQLTLAGRARWFSDLAFSPNGDALLSGSSAGAVQLWDVTLDAAPQFPLVRGNGVSGLIFAPDGAQLAVCAENIDLWRIDSAERTHTLSGHSGGVTAAAFSNDGKTLAAISGDRTIRLWDAVSGAERAAFGVPGKHLSGIAFSPDGKHLAVAVDRAVRLWEVSSRKPIRDFSEHADLVTHLVFSPSGNRLATASRDRMIALRDPNGQEAAITGAGHADWVLNLAFSADGALLASASADRTARIWDPADMKTRLVLEHRNWVSAVAFTRGGAQLMTTSGDSVTLWDTARGKVTAVLSHPSRVNAQAVSPTGGRLATACREQIKLWLPEAAAPLDPETLYRRGLQIFGYRMQDAVLMPLPRFELGGLRDGRYRGRKPRDGVNRPRPIDVSLTQWLLESGPQ